MALWLKPYTEVFYCLAEQMFHPMLVGDIALDDEDLIRVGAHRLRDQ